MERVIEFNFWTEKTYGIKCQEGNWYNRSKNCSLTKEGVKNILNSLNKGDKLTLKLDESGKFYESIYVGEKINSGVESKPVQVNLLDKKQSLIVKQNVLNRATDIAISASLNKEVSLDEVKKIARGLYEFVTGEKWEWK